MGKKVSGYFLRIQERVRVQTFLLVIYVRMKKMVVSHRPIAAESFTNLLIGFISRTLRVFPAALSGASNLPTLCLDPAHRVYSSIPFRDSCIRSACMDDIYDSCTRIAVRRLNWFLQQHSR